MTGTVTSANARSMALWRGALIALGVILLATGFGALVSEVNPSNYSGIALWLVAALIANDAIGALTVFGFSVLLRRFAKTQRGSQIPFVVFLIVQGALVVGVLVTIIVLPELVHQATGTANPSILPLDYATNLLLFHAALVTLAAVAIISVVVTRSVRLRGVRSPRAQAQRGDATTRD